MVNVTKENFIEQSNDLLKHLPTASFIAIDEEMTGISLPGTGRPPKEQPPSQRYSVLKQVPERYAIIQLGVCLFHPVLPADNKPNAAARLSSSTVPISPVTPSVQAMGADANAPAVPSFLPSAPLLNLPNGTTADKTEWTVRRYNFYMFPGAPSNFNSTDTREVVMNPSAVSFLNSHNMSFDRWTKQGIPFATESQAEAILQKYVHKQQQAIAAAAAAAEHQPTVQEMSSSGKVTLKRRDDIEFFSRAMGSLRDWLDTPASVNGQDATSSVPGGTSFLLPSCNAFLRRAFYESIEQQYPSLICESGAPTHVGQIRVLRLNQAEKKAREALMRRQGWEDIIVNKIGMWRIFSALTAVCRGEELPRESVTFADSYDAVDWNWQAYNKAPSLRKVPLVVHNGFMDILFLLTHFHSKELPENYVDTKALIRRHFPVVYDTKIVATECATPWNNDVTTLSSLYQKVVKGSLERTITVVSDTTSNDPAHQDQEHEAAYDAYMTGGIFIGLCKFIQDNSIPSELKDELSSKAISAGLGELVHLGAHEDNEDIRTCFGRNKLYQMCMFNTDLEVPTTRDPLSRGMLPDCTYRVSGISPSVNTRDIVLCVSGLTDNAGRTVNFDIIWVDQTSFMVAATFKTTTVVERPPSEDGEEVEDEDLDAILKDHGNRIGDALKNRFRDKESIVSLEAHLQSLDKPTTVEKPTFMSRVWNMFGVGSNKRESDETSDAPAKKRRRVE